MVVFNYSKISWITGIMTLLTTVLNNGLRITSKENFTAKHFGSMVKKYGVTFTISSAYFSSILMTSPDFTREDFMTMKHFMIGGERIPYNLRESIKSRMNPGCFYVAYGSTESALLTRTDCKADTSSVKDNIVGKLIENAMCKIVSITSEKVLGPNQVGRVFVKTDTMLSVTFNFRKKQLKKRSFQGYYGNERLTADCLNDGWYEMGDIGYFDDKGTLYVHGRIKDIIFINGKMVLFCFG